MPLKAGIHYEYTIHYDLSPFVSQLLNCMPLLELSQILPLLGVICCAVYRGERAHCIILNRHCMVGWISDMSEILVNWLKLLHSWCRATSWFPNIVSFFFFYCTHARWQIKHLKTPWRPDAVYWHCC